MEDSVRNWVLALFGMLSAQLWAELPMEVGGRSGYLSNVREERYVKEIEIVIISAPPPPANSQSIPLVDAKLSREFETRYEREFGRTDAERNVSMSNRFTFYDYPSGAQEDIISHEERKRQFAEYMLKRLAEHHVDQYFKSHRELRPIYELKDKIANVDVEVKKGYKLKLNYSYSGNYLDVKLDNPYKVATKITYQMKSGVGPSSIEKTIYSAVYPIDPLSSIGAFYEVDQDQGISLIGSRKLTSSLATTLTLTQNSLVNSDVQTQSQRHNLVLLGFTWTE